MQLRHTLLFILIISSSHYSYSQLHNFGVKAGLNVSNVSGIDNSTKKLGYHLGVVAMVKLNNAWTFQPEVLYSNQGFNSNDVRYNFSYINLPLLFKYQYQEFFFDFGSQIGLLFNANKVDLEIEKEKTDITGEMNNIDLSLVTGIGFMASEKIGVEGRFIAGLLSASNNADAEMYNYALQVSVFYIFK